LISARQERDSWSRSMVSVMHGGRKPMHAAMRSSAGLAIACCALTLGSSCVTYPAVVALVRLAL
jgi:hypothetical protein